MQTFNAVIAHGDVHRAEVLAHSLHGHFGRVDVTGDYETLRDKVNRNRSRFVVVDLELVSVEQVRSLCDDFRGTGVVCVHRVPDDRMWTSVVEAGAIDCCHTDDLRTILNAARSISPRRHAIAA